MSKKVVDHRTRKQRCHVSVCLLHVALRPRDLQRPSSDAIGRAQLTFSLYFHRQMSICGMSMCFLLFIFAPPSLSAVISNPCQNKSNTRLAVFDVWGMMNYPTVVWDSNKVFRHHLWLRQATGNQPTNQKVKRKAQSRASQVLWPGPEPGTRSVEEPGGGAFQ